MQRSDIRCTTVHRLRECYRRGRSGKQELGQNSRNLGRQFSLSHKLLVREPQRESIYLQCADDVLFRLLEFHDEPLVHRIVPRRWPLPAAPSALVDFALFTLVSLVVRKGFPTASGVYSGGGWGVR